MKFVSIRELRSNAAALREELAEAKELVLTVSGKPFALLTPIGSGDLEREVMAVRRARARLAVDKMREAAKRRGLDRLTPNEIDALIAKTRRSRRPRRGS
jgi:antitoxin (DNA-binding transcriptional repressor) of toxin-antitoxin stability system